MNLVCLHVDTLTVEADHAVVMLHVHMVTTNNGLMNTVHTNIYCVITTREQNGL